MALLARSLSERSLIDEEDDSGRSMLSICQKRSLEGVSGLFHSVCLFVCKFKRVFRSCLFFLVYSRVRCENRLVVTISG